MATITTIPSRRTTGHQFTHSFEELPLFWSFQDKIAWRAGTISGQFEVSFDETGDWFFSDISIACDNGELGANARGKLVNLSADGDERVYLAILDSLELRYASLVDERVTDELAALGFRGAA